MSNAPATPQKMTARTRTLLEKRLHDLHYYIAKSEGELRVNRIEAGETLSELRASFKHGQWMKYSADLYKRLKLSRKTAERYISAYKEVASFGPALRAAAQKSGLDLNKPLVRDYIKDVRTENPDASDDEIVKLTNMTMEAAAKEDEAAKRDRAAYAESARCKHPGCSRQRVLFTAVPDGIADGGDFCDEHEPPDEKARRESDAEKNFQERAARRKRFESAGTHRRRPTAQTLAEAKEIIESGYRAQATKHHPDKGGSEEKMQRINSGMSWLRQMLKHEEEPLTHAA